MKNILFFLLFSSVCYGQVSKIDSSQLKQNNIELAKLVGGAAANTRLKVPAGSTTLSAVQLSAQTLKTSPVAGDVEFSADQFYGTNSSGRAVFARVIKASATLDFPSTATNTASDLAVSVPGAVDGDAIFIGVPTLVWTGTSIFTAWVAGPDSVTVRFYNGSSAGAQNPDSGVFNIVVIK